MAIDLSSQFSLNTGLPIEKSMVVADVTARNAIASIKRFDGMFTYLVSTNQTYQLQGGVTNGDWVLISAPGGIQTLAQTLVNGNLTGGTDISISDGDGIVGQTWFGITPRFYFDQYVYTWENSGAANTTLDSSSGTFTTPYGVFDGFIAKSTFQTGESLVTDGNMLLLNATNANSINIISGATSTSYTLTLPVAQGGAGTVLSNDGTGVLSWVAAGTPALTSTQIAFGSGANLMTSSATLVYDLANTQLSISGNGTAALPALAVGGTTNGMYLSGANQLGFSTNGVNRMNLDATSLSSVTNGGFWLRRNAGSATDPTYSFKNDPDTGWYSDASNVLKWANGGTQYGTINSTGIFIGGTTTPTAKLHLAAGSTSASSAPIKLTSGPVTSVTEVGTVEFTTDDLFFTITTGTARKRLLMADPTGGLTSGRVPYATTNGRLTDSNDMTFGSSTLTVAKIKVGSGSVTLDAIDQAQYNPSATNVANIDSVSVTAANWTRVGRMVHVWGIFSVDPSSSGVLTQFTISLPITSNLSSNYDLVGGATNSVDGETAGRIYADTTADEALVEFTPRSTTSSYDWSYWFDYEII